MAKDASKYLSSLARSVSSLVPSFFSPPAFYTKTEFLSYLILCFAKMPFIPPPSLARSVPGPPAKGRPLCNISSTTLEKVQTSDLERLGEKSRPRSRLPTAKVLLGSELHATRRARPPPSSQTDRSPASDSGQTRLGHASRSGVQREPEARARRQEEVRFTLALTPEADLLLQRRNGERRQRSATRNDGSASDSRRRRENVSEGLEHGTVAARNRDAQLGDISSIVKISLLNERHKYDDVEYEEEEGGRGVDERVVLKCTEWLRGLENAPVTTGHAVNKESRRLFKKVTPYLKILIHCSQESQLSMALRLTRKPPNT
ncbi:Proline-rich protein 18 [Liparis tanakae]|uniref:Proline-rich protein 18 n=1 Tax=Liparis tanakae TaxID=230148 RepID=A0A4Z2G182_9TELE|nr:Proline-rich protein 18 [Liparis tanakae]